MTEAKWLEAIDPIEKLKFLIGSASDRKLMLYATACCRRIWHLYLNVRCQRAVDVMERFLEGECSVDDVLAAGRDADDAYLRASEDQREIAKRIDGRFPRDDYPPYVRARLARAVAETARHFTGDPYHAAHYASTFARKAAGDRSYLSLAGMTPEHEPEGCAQDMMLRDIFGSPFRPAAAGAFPAAVSGFARAIYEERDFDRMPKLADALKVTGFTNEDMLTHCRVLRPHVRGCWVVDLVLGKP